MAGPPVAWPPPAYPQVDVPGAGPVSLAALDELREVRQAQQASVERLAWEAAELAAQAEDRLADAGALLVPWRAWWQVPPALSPLLAEADRLVPRISQLDEAIAGLERGQGTAGTDPLSRLRAWYGERGVRGERARAGRRLRQTLVAVAQGGAAAGAGVPGVEALVEQAGALRAHAGGREAALAEASTRLAVLDQELARREEAARYMGFDSLHLAAYFRAYGPAAIGSPVALEPREVALLATAAELARPRPGAPRAGGAAGPGAPAAYTDIRHWVGTFRRRGTPLQGLDRIDSGTLVVTSQRLVFLGRTEAVGISLAGVVDIDVYSDGVAVTQLGREHPDHFLVVAPEQVTFYLNWAIDGTMRR